MNKELISVIVPVYKVESHLNRCIESLVNQTYQKLEIILVDDGSPDDCGTICDAWKMKDGRIQVIHKQNAGLGMARNSGLEIASGDYVAFVDSDDYVKTDHIEALYKALRRHSADLAVGGFLRRSSGKVEEQQVTEKETLLSENEIIEKLFLPMLGAEPSNKHDVEQEICVWRNLYRRDLIKKGGICFVSEREYVSEDIFFNMLYLIYSKKAVLIPACNYVYCDTPGSLTNSYRSDRMEKYCRMLEYQVKILKEHHLFEQAKLRLLRTFIMKTKKCIFLASSSGLSFYESRKACRKIIGNETLKTVLEAYECAEGIRKSQKMLLFLMKHQWATAILILYRIKYRCLK